MASTERNYRRLSSTQRRSARNIVGFPGDEKIISFRKGSLVTDCEPGVIFADSGPPITR